MAQGKGPVEERGDGASRSREIAADIDRTRDALDRTVDAIVGKLSPSQLLMECVHVVRSGSGSILGRVVETAREHPVPATIVATGLGMLLWERSGSGGYQEAAGRGPVERVKEKARDATHGMAERLDEVKDSVQEGTHHVKEAAHQAKDKVTEKLQEAKETTQQAKDVVREKLHDVKDAARHKVKDARIGFWQTMDRQPLVIGGIALALGAAAALLLPATDREDELMGEARERFKDKAEDVGRQVLEKGKQVARTAAGVLHEEVREQGLTPQQIAEKVRVVARETEQAAIRETEQELA
jgi:hypothetical protein